MFNIYGLHYPKNAVVDCFHNPFHAGPDFDLSTDSHPISYAIITLSMVVILRGATRGALPNTPNNLISATVVTTDNENENNKYLNLRGHEIKVKIN